MPSLVLRAGTTCNRESNLADSNTVLLPRFAKWNEPSTTTTQGFNRYATGTNATDHVLSRDCARR